MGELLEACVEEPSLLCWKGDLQREGMVFYNCNILSLPPPYSSHWTQNPILPLKHEVSEKEGLGVEVLSALMVGVRRVEGGRCCGGVNTVEIAGWCMAIQSSWVVFSMYCTYAWSGEAVGRERQSGVNGGSEGDGTGLREVSVLMVRRCGGDGVCVVVY